MEVEVKNIKKCFGEKIALDIENYKINSGEIVGLVGNNGAGKTTLFRAILDLIETDNGSVTIGQWTSSETEDWKDVTGSYIDSGYLIEYLTPDEYLKFIAKVCHINDEEYQNRIKRFEDFMNGEVCGQDKLIRHLSAGNKQKVGVVAAMLNNPKLLILDEPFNYLDPTSQMAMEELIRDYNKDTGCTVIISSHSLEHTFGISTRITLLEQGKIIKDLRQQDCDNMRKEIEDYFYKN